MWQPVKVYTEDVWMEEALDSIFRASSVAVPNRITKFGNTTVTWEEVEPGIVFIKPMEGNIQDRIFAYTVIANSLEAVGYQPVLFKTAAWPDIEEKAKRYVQDGRVTLQYNFPEYAGGTVTSETSPGTTYETAIYREDPQSDALTMWTCDCPWSQFAWGRTRKWKPLEGRVCVHALAIDWVSKLTPVHGEEYDPTSGYTEGEGGQLGFGAQEMSPSMSPVMSPGPAIKKPRQQMAPGPTQQFSIPGVFDQSQALPPQNPTIPNFQPFPAPPVPVSVPGAKQPSPANPIQNPGTYSKWKFAADESSYTNGDMVRLNVEEYGIAVGRSEAHGAGQYRKVPQNSIGEVLGTDPTTGWLTIIFPIHDSGPMEPWGIQMIIEPSSVSPASWVRPPGPFLKRRRER